MDFVSGALAVQEVDRGCRWRVSCAARAHGHARQQLPTPHALWERSPARHDDLSSAIVPAPRANVPDVPETGALSFMRTAAAFAPNPLKICLAIRGLARHSVLHGRLQFCLLGGGRGRW